MKILVVDDDPAISDVIQLTFELGWPEVKLITAETGEKGINFVETDSPSAVILDLGLPDMSGFEVLKAIRLFSEVPILILTVDIEERAIVKALTWGANDYLAKPFRQMEFLARVKAMTRNMQITDRDMAISYGSWHFGRSLTELYHGQILLNLTPVEGFIMHTLIKHAGQYIDGDSLVLKVWGDTQAATADSLRVHIYHLRKKLGDDHEHPSLLVNRPGRGYMFCEPDKEASVGGIPQNSNYASTMQIAAYRVS